jgi:deoxyribose-phosphate aldolase
MKNMPSSLSKAADRVRNAGLDPRTARDMINCLDISAVNGNVNPMLVNAICRDADQGRHGASATVTVHPNYLTNAFNNGARGRVPVACIMNYPDGKGTVFNTERDTRSAVARGVKEIEIVIDHEAFKRGDKDSVRALLTACRRACGKDAKMKVVLEGSSFTEFSPLYEAACLAIDCGADMLVTGTAVNEMRSNTALEHAAVILMAIRDNGKKIGLKIGGEHDNARAHAPYFALARNMMGADWVRPENFRIGGRALQSEALAVLNGTAARPMSPPAGTGI